jgi:AcrR family transcriptional regulator
MATPRRGYTSPIRDEQARKTRQRIVTAADELFRAHGYVGTRLETIAARAGVSVQTVYNAVGGKAAVLKAVYDVTLAGDDEPVPMGQRPAFLAMLEETDARRCLARYARVGREIGERLQPLLAIVLAPAAGADKDLAAFAETVENERAAGTQGLAGHVADRFGLRPGLDVEGAADILWTLTSPDVADRLVHRRGWGWDRFERWIGETMADALLGPAEPVDQPVDSTR